MKFTLAEVLDGYIVIWDNDTKMSYMYGDVDPKRVAIYGGDMGQFEAYFDSTQTVEADGDSFIATDENEQPWQFYAYKVVRLNEVPELR